MRKIALVKDKMRFWQIYERILRRYSFQVCLLDIWRKSEQDRLFSENFDSFIWRAKHDPVIKNLAKRFIYFFGQEFKIPTYPDWRSYWHYDDKIAQYYLFTRHHIPTPKTYIFFNQDEAVAFAQQTRYPLVYKCAHGAGSSNVGLLEDPKTAMKYIRRVFNKGIKTYFKNEVQKGYVYFQEFLGDNQGDYRIVCYGNRVIYGFFRPNRDKSPFASGSGLFDTSEIPVEVLDLGARANEQMNFEVMSYDILRDYEGKWLVTEMSVIYGDLSSPIYKAANGYYRDKNSLWQKIGIGKDRHEEFIRHLLTSWNWIEG